MKSQEITTLISNTELENLFSFKKYTKNIDLIFSRVYTPFSNTTLSRGVKPTNLLLIIIKRVFHLGFGIINIFTRHS